MLAPNVSMAWLPEQLMTKTLNNSKMWAQHIKQFVLMTSGIETKSQGEMDKGGRENYIMTEYSRWLEILMAKFPDAAVHPWLKFTTGTRTTKIDGKYLYRNFQEGLRIYHRDFNTTWEAVLKEGISGKSKEEVSFVLVLLMVVSCLNALALNVQVWCRFCYLFWCTSRGIKPDDVTPKDFDYKKIESKKWIYSFKYMGPPCEFLELGECTCHEFLANPTELSSRGTSSLKRKTKGKPNTLNLTPSLTLIKLDLTALSRAAHREAKSRRTKEAVASAYAEKHEFTAVTLGRTQSIQNLMQLQQKAAHDRFEQMYKLFTIVQDDVVKQELQRQMLDSLQCPLKSFKAVETELYGASSSNPICLLAPSDEEDPPSPLSIPGSDDDDISIHDDSNPTMTKVVSQVRGPQPQPQHHPNTVTITITIGNG